MGGPIVLAYYLFACGTDQREKSNKASIARDELYKRLRISFRWSNEDARAFNRAQVSVNSHLAGLVSEIAYGLPIAFAIEEDEGGRMLRIRAIYPVHDHSSVNEQDEYESEEKEEKVEESELSGKDQLRKAYGV